MGTKVTIYEIAERAGVGIGTVSRVLNNHPNVTPETRERVREIIRQMSYQPHTYAQRLARNHSETICVIIPFFTNYFSVEILRGVQEGMGRLGYDLTLFGVNDIEQVESKMARALQRGRVDGILFFSMRLPDKIVPRLRETGIPIVLVDSFYPKFESLSVANADGAYDATTHLISLGHRRIGMINALERSVPATERLQGYRRAIESNGIPYSAELVKVGTSTKEDGFNRDAGYEAMLEFIKMGPDMPRAFFVSSDIQAMGAVSALGEHGCRVPEDVSVIGFDDIELAKHIRLTTMRQPMYRMGLIAVERLAARMSNPDMQINHTTFLPELVVRETTAAPGRIPKRA